MFVLTIIIQWLNLDFKNKLICNTFKGNIDDHPNYDEQNQMYMHKIGAPCNTTPRFGSRENLREHEHQITPNHISRNYEVYADNGDKIERGM